MKIGDRVEHRADKAKGTVKSLEPYMPATELFPDGEIPGAGVLWDGEKEVTIHPLANIEKL